jgi:hypothetical protein
MRNLDTTLLASLRREYRENRKTRILFARKTKKIS